jgi:hypothetical protein
VSDAVDPDATTGAGAGADAIADAGTEIVARLDEFTGIDAGAGAALPRTVAGGAADAILAQI